MRRWILAMTVAVLALLPVGVALSASPGSGPGCTKNKDGTFHGYCVHNKTVTRTHTATVKSTRSTTQTATENITSGSTTTVGGGHHHHDDDCSRDDDDDDHPPNRDRDHDHDHPDHRVHLHHLSH